MEENRCMHPILWHRIFCSFHYFSVNSPVILWQKASLFLLILFIVHAILLKNTFLNMSCHFAPEKEKNRWSLLHNSVAFKPCQRFRRQYVACAVSILKNLLWTVFIIKWFSCEFVKYPIPEILNYVTEIFVTNYR